MFEIVSLIAIGQMIRHTDYTRDDHGNALQTKRMIEQNVYAITDATFDEYGNVLTLIKPESHNGERLQTSYQYDEELHYFLISEIDGHDLEKKYEYDIKHQLMNYFEDENGNPTIYKVDPFGRIHQTIFPREIEAGLDYSINYEYILDADNPYTINRYYTAEGNIEIIQFTDGLHREIQNKRAYTFEDGEGYIVSGWVIYDELQRVHKVHHPSKTTTGPYILDNNIDPTTPDIQTYDALDRITSLTDSYGHITHIDYQIVDTYGKTLEEKITNPQGFIRYNYRDFKGNLIAETYDAPTGAITTLYTYDGAQQITSITDANGNTSKYKNIEGAR